MLATPSPRTHALLCTRPPSRPEVGAFSAQAEYWAARSYGLACLLALLAIVLFFFKAAGREREGGDASERSLRVR